MKHIGSSVPLARFDLPPCMPKRVLEACAAYSAVGDRWARAVGDLDDAKEAVERERKLAAEENAAAYLRGEDVSDPDRRVREAIARMEMFQAAERSLALAVDQAGNHLADVIAEEREPAIAALLRTREKAEARYDAAIAAALDALAQLEPLERAVEWLRDFDASAAQVGYQQQFSGGRLRIRNRGFGPLKGDHDVRDLLALAARATEKLTVPQVAVEDREPEEVAA